MKIKQVGTSYYLYEGLDEWRLSTSVIINGRAVVIRKYYKSLVGKELGSLEHIIGKTFQINNGVYELSNGFVNYLLEEEKKDLLRERNERAEARPVDNNYDWDRWFYFDDLDLNNNNPF